MKANKDTIPRVYSLLASTKFCFMDGRVHHLGLVITSDDRFIANWPIDLGFGRRLSRIIGAWCCCYVNSLNLQESYLLLLTLVPPAVLVQTQLQSINCHERLKGPQLCITSDSCKNPPFFLLWCAMNLQNDFCIPCAPEISRLWILARPSLVTGRLVSAFDWTLVLPWIIDEHFDQ